MMRRTAAVAVALVAGLLTAADPAQAAAPVDVTPDVAKLPVGALPKLPYVNWPKRQIVDGGRRVSIAGIKARVIALHKVDGGYLLLRRIGGQIENDVVFVSVRGARRVLVEHWEESYWALKSGLAVSHNGDRIVVNTNDDIGGEAPYVDTRVVTVPGGKVIRAREFHEDGVSLLAYGVDRALLSDANGTQWWNPAKNTVTTLAEDSSGDAADLSAWQWVFRTGVFDTAVYSFEGLPPGTSPSWTFQEDHVNAGPWSPDDNAMVSVDNAIGDVPRLAESSEYTVRRTADGAVVLRLHGKFPPQFTWESNSAVLLRTRTGLDSARRYQLIRCTLAGVCQKVGPPTGDRDGAIIPATRRNS
jgi:hypothetical protein